MPKDRYAATNNRQRAEQSRRDDYDVGAYATKETWRTSNLDQTQRIQRLIADPLCEVRSGDALTRWLAFLQKSDLHTLSRAEFAALVRIERAVELRRKGVPDLPKSERRPRPRTSLGLRLSPRPDWMADPSKLPKAPPGSSR